MRRRRRGIVGRRLRVDEAAVSARSGEPAFVARPEGAPVYFGFPVLDDVLVEGFRLGMITDWEAEEADVGDAFIVGPDGRRAGLNWEANSAPRVTECLPPEEGRWGVWNVWFSGPLHTRDDAKRMLSEIVPLLRPHYEATRRPG